MILNKFQFERNTKDFRIFNLALLIVFLSLYALNKFYLHSFNSFFQFYFSDLLAIVVLFSLLNIIYPIKIKNLWIIILITALAAFFWEYIAIFIKQGAIFDYMDIFAYFISMLIYLLILYFKEGEIDV